MMEYMATLYSGPSEASPDKPENSGEPSPNTRKAATPYRPHLYDGKSFISDGTFTCHRRLKANCKFTVGYVGEEGNQFFHSTGSKNRIEETLAERQTRTVTYTVSLRNSLPKFIKQLRQR